MSATLSVDQATYRSSRLTRAELMRLLDTSERGLSTSDVQHRLARYGANEPQQVRQLAGARQLLAFAGNPLVIILLIASLVSAVLGERINAAIIAVMVSLSVAINFVQTDRSQRAAERLRGTVAPTCHVLRDGDWRELPRRALVPGDVIRLSAGDLVPADARLIESHHLHVHEAALTGESIPVEKEASDEILLAASSAEARGLVLLGTSVVSGTAIAVVVATGRATTYGDVIARLVARPPETEFDRGIRQFGFLIMRTVVFLVLFVLVVTIGLRHDTLESLVFALALAVGLTPEFLPMITTVTLAQGALHMARQQVIVKHLAAIQNFGSMDILCSDKTGTLTSGEMVLDQHIDPLGYPSPRVMRLAYLNSANE